MTMHISLIPSSKITKQTCTEMLLLQPPAKFCMFVWGIFLVTHELPKDFSEKLSALLTPEQSVCKLGGKKTKHLGQNAVKKNCLVLSVSKHMEIYGIENSNLYIFLGYSPVCDSTSHNLRSPYFFSPICQGGWSKRASYETCEANLCGVFFLWASASQAPSTAFRIHELRRIPLATLTNGEREYAIPPNLRAQPDLLKNIVTRDLPSDVPLLPWLHTVKLHR